MNNRLYKFIVAIQIGMITLLLFFILNAEQVLQNIRDAAPASSDFTQDQSWNTVSSGCENRYS